MWFVLWCYSHTLPGNKWPILFCIWREKSPGSKGFACKESIISWKKKQNKKKNHTLWREESPWKTLVTYLPVSHWPLYKKTSQSQSDRTQREWHEASTRFFAHIPLQTLLCYNAALNFTSRDRQQTSVVLVESDKKSAKWNFLSFITETQTDNRSISEELFLYRYSLMQSHHLISECDLATNKFRQRIGPLLGNPENDSWDQVSVKVLWYWPKDYSYHNLLHTQTPPPQKHTHTLTHTLCSRGLKCRKTDCSIQHLILHADKDRNCPVCVSLTPSVRLSVWHTASCFTIHFQFRLVSSGATTIIKKGRKKKSKEQEFLPRLYQSRCCTHTLAHTHTNLFSASFFSTHTQHKIHNL